MLTRTLRIEAAAHAKKDKDALGKRKKNGEKQARKIRLLEDGGRSEKMIADVTDSNTEESEEEEEAGPVFDYWSLLPELGTVNVARESKPVFRIRVDSESDEDDTDPLLGDLTPEEYDLKVALQTLLTVVDQSSAYMDARQVSPAPELADEFAFFRQVFAQANLVALVSSLDPPVQALLK